MEQLTKDQQIIFDAIESSFDNFLILGKPGVGKSVLIRALVESGAKSYTIAAPTGIAAININGHTLHSIFKIPVFENGILTDDISIPSREQLSRLYSLKTLIIDEISMVRADVLDYIDRTLKAFHGNERPFGGIQVIMVGDFCQLPPVANKDCRAELLKHGYQSEFAFSARVFNLEQLKVHQLTEVLRQAGDNYFMEILSAARFGNVTTSMIRDLNELCGAAKAGSITLTATNSQADLINNNEMARLTSQQYTFQAIVQGNWPPTLYPLPEYVNLKVGAQVMVKKNKANRPPNHKGEFESTVVNGTIGKIISIDPSNTDGPPKVLVQTEDGRQVTIYRQEFERSVKEQVNGKWVKKVIASYEQMPLVPAWAISMHKSQGISLATVNIDPSRIFADGQLYVALSRARTMAGITFLNEVNAWKFTVNRFVKMFYETIAGI